MRGDGVLKHFVVWYIMLICDINIYFCSIWKIYDLQTQGGREEADTAPKIPLTLSHILKRKMRKVMMSNSPWIWKITYLTFLINAHRYKTLENYLTLSLVEKYFK